MRQKATKVTKARKMSWPWLKLPENSSPAKTKTFLTHSLGRPVLIAARSGLRRGTTGSSMLSDSPGGGTVGCSEVIVSIKWGDELPGRWWSTPPERVAKGYRRPQRGARSGVEENARVQDRGRVELGLGGPQGGSEGGRALAVVPGAMVAADRVVMGDRAAALDQRLGHRGLDLVPLLDLAAADR